MTWLVWRQHRKQLLFTVLGLAALAGLLIPTGLAMYHSFDELNLGACTGAYGHPEQAQACFSAVNRFTNEFSSLVAVGFLLAFLPIVVGLFWGAPLVAREIEHGTHRMVWTQGVSRRRWALVKFGLVGAATLLFSIVYGLGMSWWLTPLSRLSRPSRFESLAFDIQGVAPIGYTLFAVALGVFAGTIWHKVLPAMAVTLTGFIGLRVLVAALGRPNYLPAEERKFATQGALPPNPFSGDWIQSTGVYNASGELILANAEASCPPGAGNCGGGPGDGSYNLQVVQPGDRFWAFQAIETGIYVALAALLLYVAVRRISRIA